MISIHALLAESDRLLLSKEVTYGNFYPRSPCGERPQGPLHRGAVGIFLSTLSLRRATVLDALSKEASTFLSTLSLRRATQAGNIVNAAISISIHALLAESDRTGYHGRADRPHFYPRSPCGERLTDAQSEAVTTLISIHALLAESDG